jgi:hypothetical protein
MELFDPRIIDDEYEPHEEAAQVRGYIPEVGREESSSDANEGLGHTNDNTSVDVVSGEGEPADRTVKDPSGSVDDRLPHRA